jgi:hypothetical protein
MVKEKIKIIFKPLFSIKESFIVNPEFRIKVFPAFAG